MFSPLDLDSYEKRQKKEGQKRRSKRHWLKSHEMREKPLPVIAYPLDRSSQEDEDGSVRGEGRGGEGGEGKKGTERAAEHGDAKRQDSATASRSSASPPKAWRIKTPTQIHLYAPSMAGKSTLILKIIRYSKHLFDQDFAHVIYCSPLALENDDSDYVSELRAVCRESQKVLEILGKIPSIEEISEFGGGDTSQGSHPVLLVLDDVMCLENLEALNKLSSLISHHKKISLVLALQNAFQRNKSTDFVSVARNCTGKFILWQTADMRYITQLNTNMFPERKHFLLDCLRAAKAMGLNYIYLDTHPFSSLDRRFIAMTALFNDAPQRQGEEEEEEKEGKEEKWKEPICFDLFS